MRRKSTDSHPNRVPGEPGDDRELQPESDAEFDSAEQLPTRGLVPVSQHSRIRVPARARPVTRDITDERRNANHQQPTSHSEPTVGTTPALAIPRRDGDPERQRDLPQGDSGVQPERESERGEQGEADDSQREQSSRRGVADEMR
ncbi:hypothetical protein [Halorubrum sp. SP9]|uniref:hypothetical protein n=1 Tax=Halorubrum sp. SP9 TaxID=1537267 RepID=UPI0013051C88|nr:hypothetical protein [Halorubrum sp. SP9]